MGTVRKRVLTKKIAITLVAAALIIVVIGAWILIDAMTPHYYEPIHVQLGVRCERNTDQNWTVFVTQGSEDVKDMYVVVINPNTGEETVKSRLSLNETDDFFFKQINDDRHLNPGDQIILKESSPNIQVGYLFVLYRGYNVTQPKPLP